MTTIHHLNCVRIESPFGSAIGHCLLLEDKNGLALVDAGIGLLDTLHPSERLGDELIALTGFVFDENLTALRQIEKLGFKPEDVKHCITTHLDPDHIGGVVDFPNLQIHVAQEEYDSFQTGHPRYLPLQLAHRPEIHTYTTSNDRWFGLEARKVALDFESEVYLVPLFGHTLGHCGVAIRQEDRWVFHIGDAYYLRAELEDENHPVNTLAEMRAENNALRLESRNKIKRLLAENKQLEVFGYHDPEEFPTRL